MAQKWLDYQINFDSQLAGRVEQLLERILQPAKQNTRQYDLVERDGAQIIISKTYAHGKPCRADEILKIKIGNSSATISLPVEPSWMFHSGLSYLMVPRFIWPDIAEKYSKLFNVVNGLDNRSMRGNLEFKLVNSSQKTQ